MNYIRTLATYFFLLTAVHGFTQGLLSKKEAVNLLLQNNYDVLVANNNVQIAKNGTTIYNNNHLPTVTANAGGNYSNTNITANRQDGTSSTLNGATADSYNASLNVNYTIFDGFRRRYSSERAEENFSQSELIQRATVENSILELFRLYYEVARLTQNAATLRQTLDISKNRLQRAEYPMSVLG